MSILEILEPTMNSHIENEVSKLNNVRESEVLYEDGDYCLVKIILEDDRVKYMTLFISDDKCTTEFISAIMIRAIVASDPSVLQR